MSRGWVEEIVTGNNPAFGINYSMYKKYVFIFFISIIHIYLMLFSVLYFFSSCFVINNLCCPIKLDIL